VVVYKKKYVFIIFHLNNFGSNIVSVWLFLYI